MSENRGTAWIQALNKQEIIDELRRRGLEASEEFKLEDLRRVLRKDCKSKAKGKEIAVVKGNESELSDGSEVDEVKSRIEETGGKKIAIEYTAKLYFKRGTDDWEDFVKRIELYFEANDIDDEGKQKSIFLTKIDAETYSVVRKVCAPKKPKETDLNDIITKMGNYLKPNVNETVLRQPFQERRQKENESAAQYIAGLRSLARNCKFKDENEALRDQLITGIRNKAIKVALFKIENLTLDVAIKTATAIEGANKAAETLEPQTVEKDSSERNDDFDAHRIQFRGRNMTERRTRFTPRAGRTERQQSTSRTRCSCCGKPNHYRRNCWHLNKQCETFGKTGYLQAVCKGAKPCLGIRIENKQLEMEIDDGSAVSIISEIDREKYFPRLELEEAKVTLSYYSGEKRKPLGILRGIKIEYGAIATKTNCTSSGKREKVSPEIDRLVTEKILWPVEVSDRGTPVVPTIKPDGTVRLCGDYKVTVNPNIAIDRCPLPKVEHLIASLQRGKFFTKIDLKEAYAQVPLSEDSKKYLTINTHKGLYQYNKLAYGIASAPGYFQREMEKILAKMRNATVFLDDIIIKGGTMTEIVKNSTEVVEKLTECLKIDEHRVHTLKDKIAAIVEAPNQQV
ncbi:uncharacterized protein LOC107227278 [Neodiprion lecontei]|uniref:Uncharacterized protein LOC107227278 n=1 Tax=Neodiprion lecontei TaxID=441921 RepID=A0ABM3FQE7_NEOLC|nr:uncharacterized protein LOC107227278 [Neodiprion lecontei]